MEEIIPPDTEVNEKREYLKFALVIIGIITVSYVHYQFSINPALSDAIRIFMGYFMIIFGGFKLAGYKMFVVMFPTYDIVANKFKFYAKMFPFIEVGLGSLALTNTAELFRLIAVTTVMGAASIGVAQEVYRKKSGTFYCACLGNVIKLPLSTVSFAENVSMTVLALAMLIIR